MVKCEDKFKWLRNPVDTEDNPLTYDRLLKWVIDTHYVDHLIKKKLSPLDKNLEEDFIQEIWLQILLIPQDKFMSIWYKGKGKFTNYIKAIVMNSVMSVTSPVYYNTKGLFKNELHLTDEQWVRFEEGEDESDVTLLFPSPESDYKKKEMVWVEERQQIRSLDKLSEEDADWQEEG